MRKKQEKEAGMTVAGGALRLVPQRDTAAAHWRVEVSQTDRRRRFAGVAGYHDLRGFPTISNQFQSLFKKNMRSRNQNAARLAGWVVSVGSERRLAGESGVAARALPPQSKIRRLQPVLPWEGDTMCRGLAAANSMGFDELRWFPVNSNQFQSIPITFQKI